LSTRLLPFAVLALLAALVAGLVLALRHDPGGPPARLQDRPVSAVATLSPREPQFGDTVVATLDVRVDPRRVDPNSVGVTAGYAPYRVTTSERTVLREEGVSVIHLESRLRCLGLACVPPGAAATVRFQPVRVSYREGSQPRSLAVTWPALHVHSRVAATDLRHPLLRVPPPHASSGYRFPPRPTGYALLALAAVLALGGSALLLLVALRHFEPARSRTGAPLERILDELAAASSNGDSGRRRRALEELARELEPFDSSLSAESRVLAWGPEDPRAEAVAELAGRAQTMVRR
jgi:hypothetical protein